MVDKNISSEEVYKAAKILKLGELMTMEEIKKKYRQLIKRWHPDSCPDDPEKCQQKTEEITGAYKIIILYCSNYCYSFKRGDIANHLPMDKRMDEQFRKQFGDVTSY